MSEEAEDYNTGNDDERNIEHHKRVDKILQRAVQAYMQCSPLSGGSYDLAEMAKLTALTLQNLAISNYAINMLGMVTNGELTNIEPSEVMEGVEGILDEVVSMYERDMHMDAYRRLSEEEAHDVPPNGWN